MKKHQAQTFWGLLRDTTVVGDVVRKFHTARGYGGKRTLERYAQAYVGFAGGLPDEKISRPTGWSTSYVAKIRPWYDELVGAASEDERDVRTREQLPRLIEAIESYKLELAGRVQAVTEGTFHALDFEGEDLPYGPLQKQIIEALRRRDDQLVKLEQSLDQALGQGQHAAATDLLEQIYQALERRNQLEP